MSEPRRLIDTGTARERALLEAGRSDGPSEASMRSALLALGLEGPPPSVPPPTAAPVGATAAGATGLGLAGWLGALAAGVSALIIGLSAGPAPAPDPAATIVAVAPEPRSEPAAPAGLDRPTGDERAGAEPVEAEVARDRRADAPLTGDALPPGAAPARARRARPAPPVVDRRPTPADAPTPTAAPVAEVVAVAPPPAAPRGPSLADELSTIARARAALADRRPADARALLTDYAGAHFAVEAAALLAEAWLQLDLEAGRSRVEAFTAAHPNHPLEARLRRALLRAERGSGAR